ncbi:hypothetical protein AA0111_g9248 [Alternaria arborescens]|uniref:hypothetical protein n=1 Tax=Alternaria arborescens TaxID=156630 RepID=UPI001074EF24|nr:hypothetical protein AA0111_g9248 [Alternaria arborescens]RYO22772.1 hypothetical protein AA0111_g9248 [Alternaria arborescens]
MAVAHNRVNRETPVFDGMDPNSESAPPCRVVTPGSDAKEHRLFLGPLRRIRETGSALYLDNRERLLAFIDSYMAESLQTIVERDGILGNVVYANWARYEQLLAVFGFASGMDAMLAVGSDKFDNYTYVVDSTRAEHVVGWKALASASKRDLDMAILSQELIQICKGMWIEGGAGYPGTSENSEQ